MLGKLYVMSKNLLKLEETDNKLKFSNYHAISGTAISGD